jgi:glutaminyl-peptide cyclotransferase
MLTLIRLPLLLLLLATQLTGCGEVGPRDEPFADTSVAGGVRTYRAVIVQGFPHDPQAFTQGLEYHGGYLYESIGREGRSALRRVDLTSGRVLQEHRLDDQYFAEGLTILNDRIYQLTWKHGRGFVYDRETFAVLDSFSYTGEGWGLANDGTSLIMSDGTNVLRFLDPDTRAVTRTISVRRAGTPVTYLNELEYIDGQIWANVWMSEWIMRIDPQSGNVIGMIDAQRLRPTLGPTDRSDVLNGIAHDPETGRVFLTGKLWPRLFEVEIAGP